jgi:hypothetical protein
MGTFAALSGGSQNIAVGYNALNSVTNAVQNCAVGDFALIHLLQVKAIRQFGFASLLGSNGQFNVAVGYHSLLGNNANNNVAIGSQQENLMAVAIMF